MSKYIGKYSLKVKLIISFMAVGFFPAIVISWQAWWTSADSFDKEASVKLGVIRDIKSNQIESLFKTMEGQVRVFSSNALTIDAMKSFARGFADYASESSGVATRKEIDTSLRNYYINQFGEEYKTNNGGKRLRNVLKNLSSLKNL